jgi:hypothetical protein
VVVRLKSWSLKVRIQPVWWVPIFTTSIRSVTEQDSLASGLSGCHGHRQPVHDRQASMCERVVSLAGSHRRIVPVSSEPAQAPDLQRTDSAGQIK